MQGRKSLINTICILLYIAAAASIVMAIVNIISVLVDVTGFVEKLNDQLFGPNGTMTVAINQMLNQGIYTEDEVKEIMELSLSAGLYSAIISSVIGLLLSALIVPFIYKLRKLKDIPSFHLVNHKKLFKTVRTLAIILIFVSAYGKILFLIGAIIMGTQKRNAIEEYEYFKALKQKGINVDMNGNIIKEEPTLDDTIVKEDIIDIKEDKEIEEINNTPKLSTQDMEDIYTSLANLEHRYKNNEVSKEEYEETKASLLSKIK